MAYESELKTALEAVRKASLLCVEVQQSLVSEETLAKKDRSPVTVADFGAQAVVSAALEADFPADPLVGEEDAGELREEAQAELRARVVDFACRIRPEMDEASVLAAIDRGQHAGGASGRHWTLDPIDGTKGFLRGEQFAVALALIEDGQVVLGVLGCPNLALEGGQPGLLLHAVRGQGAACASLAEGAESQPIATTAQAEARQLRFCESVESAHTAHSHSAQIAEGLGVEAAPVRMDSQCKYAAVAAGMAEAYLRLPTRAGYEEKIWDHAAGLIIVEEAGGKVSDIEGKPLDFSLGRTLRENRGVVATNAPLHEAVLAEVARVFDA